jgi:hypothetical protein
VQQLTLGQQLQRVDEVRGNKRHPATNATLFLSFPHVCPEPVLVKSSVLYINDAERQTSRRIK